MEHKHAALGAHAGVSAPSRPLFGPHPTSTWNPPPQPPSPGPVLLGLRGLSFSAASWAGEGGPHRHEDGPHSQALPAPTPLSSSVPRCVRFEILEAPLGILSESCSVCVRLFTTPFAVARLTPLSVEFSRPEYWSGYPCPSSGDLPNPGMGPRSATFQADSLV